MARKLIVEVIADPSQYIRGLDRASKATGHFTQNVERSSRGVAVASIGLKGLGRAALGASGYFIGGFAVAETLRSIADAGGEAIATQRQLQAQLKASGINFEAVHHDIEEAVLSLSRLSGFNADELEKSFTTLVRTTGDVDRALELNRVAADVARGRHIALAQAAVALAKAEAGNLTSLRRLGITLPKTASATEALRIVAQRFAGQAEAGATATEKFHAQLHNTEAIIGVEVLPKFNELLGKLTDYLAKTNESGKTQGFAAQSATVLADAFATLGAAIGVTVEAYRKLREFSDKGPPSKFLFDVLFTPKYTIKALETIRDRLNDVKAAIKGTGDQAEESGVAVGAFFHTMGEGLQGLGVTRSPLLGLQDDPFAKADPFSDAFDRAIPKGVSATTRNRIFDSQIARQLDVISDLPLRQQAAQLRAVIARIEAQRKLVKDVTRRLTLGDEIRAIRRTIKQNEEELATQAKASRDAARAATKQRRDDAVAAKLGAAQLRVDRAGLTTTLRDDLVALQAQQRTIRNLIRQYGRTLELQSDLVSVQSQIAAKRKEIETNEKKAAEARRTRRQATLFERLGLTATGEPRTPGLNTLRAELRQINAAAGEGLLTLSRNMRSRLKVIAAILKAGDPGQAVRAAIASILDPIKEGTKQADADWTKFRTVNAKHFLALAGLTDISAGQRARVERLFAMAGPGFTLPGASTPAFAGQGGGVHIHGDVHVHGVSDVAQFENDLAARAKQRPSRRRGA